MLFLWNSTKFISVILPCKVIVQWKILFSQRTTYRVSSYFFVSLNICFSRFCWHQNCTRLRNFGIKCCFFLDCGYHFYSRPVHRHTGDRKTLKSENTYPKLPRNCYLVTVSHPRVYKNSLEVHVFFVIPVYNHTLI